MSKDLMQAFTGQIEIPEVVEERVEETLRLIREIRRETADRPENTSEMRETAGQESVSEGQQEEGQKEKILMQRRRTKGRNRRTIFIAAAAAVLGAGCVTVGATGLIRSWSHGFEATLRPTKEQKELVESSGIVQTPAQESGKASVTENGITITAEQSLVDEYYAMISFKVEGWQLPDQTEPSFDDFSIEVEGNPFVNMSAGFYDGLLAGPDGFAVQEDGSPFEVNEDGSLKTYYLREDGSYEYDCFMMADQAGGFFGRQVTATFRDFGSTPGKLEHETAVEGTWVLGWKMEGGSHTREASSGEALGDSGATLLAAEISPLSLHTTMTFPYEKVTETGTDEDGEEFAFETYVEPPVLYGLKLKDGTLLLGVMDGPGFRGYSNKEAGLYEERMRIDRLIDPEEVEALLYINADKYGFGDGVPTEEQLYVVPVK